MAVAAPLLMLMVLGIMQFGVAFNNNVMLTDAVRAGARTLSTTRGNSDPCTTAATKLRSAATGLRPSNLSVTIRVNNTNYGPGAAGSIPGCAGAGTSMVGGDDATATGSYPCSLVVYGINFLPGCTLTSQTTVRVE
jgi:Flp pilus assembly protein TadG